MFRLPAVAPVWWSAVLVAALVATGSAQVRQRQDRPRPAPQPSAQPQPEGPPAPEPQRELGSIVGRVVDAEGEPVAGSMVIVCDTASGVPIDAETLKPFTSDVRRAQSGQVPLIQVLTGPEGRFAMGNIPPGSYTVIAQSWPGGEAITSLLGKNGVTVRLDGRAENVEVTLENLRAGVELKPVGDRTLRVHVDSGNSDSLVIVSRRRTRMDPIVGFSGWTGPFLAEALCCNRMPEGETTFTGLPEGEVSVGVFSPDNNPAWGAATLELKKGQTTRVDVPWVALWSNGMHEPPPKFAALKERLREYAITNPAQVLKFAPGIHAQLNLQQHPLVVMSSLGPFAEEVVTLPDGSSAPFGDLVAAAGYLAYEQVLTGQGREMNAYHEATVTTEPE